MLRRIQYIVEGSFHKVKSNDLLYIFIDLYYQKKTLEKQLYRALKIKTILVAGGPYEQSYSSAIDSLVDEYDKIESMFDSDKKENEKPDVDEMFEFLESL